MTTTSPRLLAFWATWAAFWTLASAFSGPPTTAAEPFRPLVVGHRGLMQAAPECTLAAFRACIALRVGFEFDVRRTKDGTLVCLHDTTVDRTTDGHGNVNELPYVELRKLDAGARFDPAFRGERVPSIDEIFQLIAAESHSDLLFAVDLKESGEGIEEKIVRLAESRGVLDQLLFIGVTIESPVVRDRLKNSNKGARTARLVTDLAEVNTALADTKADWLYLRHFPVEADITRIHASKKATFIAGPLVAGNEPAHWSTAASRGISSILTDFPLELAHQLRNSKTTGRGPEK